VRQTGSFIDLQIPTSGAPNAEFPFPSLPSSLAISAAWITEDAAVYFSSVEFYIPGGYLGILSSSNAVSFLYYLLFLY
jgi:hypothetical protein